ETAPRRHRAASFALSPSPDQQTAAGAVAGPAVRYAIVGAAGQGEWSMPRLVLSLTAVTAVTALAALAALGSPSQAQDAASFYRGKTVKVIVSTTTGNGYDFYGRTVARHLGKHLPGNPTMLPQNMPGAGGITA